MSDAGEWVPDRLSPARLRSAVQECRGCELYQDATQAVLGDGPWDAALMVLGEQPGDQEDRVGEPFVGPAGKLLDRALSEAGIDPVSVFRTNVVKHFRFSGTRGQQRIHKSPSTMHVAACGPWLVAEMALVRPRGVVLLGGTAGKAVYGSSFRVGTTLAGSWTGRTHPTYPPRQRPANRRTPPAGCCPPPIPPRCCARATETRTWPR